jgi:hypothetical protein
MDKIPAFVGLDYHKETVRVCVVDSAGEVLGNRHCPNDVRRVIDCAERHGRVKGAAIECCEGAAAAHLPGLIGTQNGTCARGGPVAPGAAHAEPGVHGPIFNVPNPARG